MGLVNKGMTEIVSEVVDELMESRMPSSSSLRQIYLNMASKDLKAVYSDLNQQLALKSADYGNILHRCAYLCRYFITHVYMLKKYFDSFVGEDIEQLASANGDRLRVCSIGGGPGSDFFGLLLHLTEKSRFVEIKGAVLDLYPDWKDAFTSVADRIDPFRIRLKTSQIKYVHYDFFSTKVVEEVLNEIRAADIVTMVKFVSAVMANRDLCQERLQWIFSKMKPGALLFVIDNSGGGSVDQVLEAAERTASMKLVRMKSKVKFTLPESANSVPLDVKPLQNAQLSMGLWKKIDYNLEIRNEAKTRLEQLLTEYFNASLRFRMD